MDKEDMVYIYTSIKMDEIMPFAATLAGLRDYHNKWSKTEKDKYHMISLTIPYDTTYIYLNMTHELI